MGRTETLVKNTAILSIGTICTKILTFVMVPLFSRWLSTEDYGDFDLLCTYITLLIPLVTLSCGEALFRKLIDAKDRERSAGITSTCMAIVAVGCFSMLLVSAVVMYFYRPSLILSFLALSLGELLNNFLMYYARGKRKLRIYAIASIIFVVSMSLFVTLFIYVWSVGLNGILYGYAVGYVCSALLLVFKTGILQDFDKNAINRKDLKEIVAYSAPLIPNAISWWIANVSDRTIVSFVLGSTANGIYALSNKIPAICTALFSVFHLSWQETASDSISSKDREKYFNNIFNKTFILIVSLSILVLSTNKLLFDFIFDARYSDGRYYVSILMAAIIFSFMAQFIGGIFIAFQNTKVNGATTIIAAFLNITINVALIKPLGLYAASLSTLISYLVLYIIRIIKVSPYIKLQVRNDVIVNLLLFLLFAAIQYVDSLPLHLTSIPLACGIFFFSNRKTVAPYLEKIAHKLHLK